ncbi:tetratricopeptide repeat protein [Hyphomonas oceanitis]|uniref:tetratricopeptide repeat protein n=1 Tax=Hyphomonas oceanitis TaxID=81033 RepID=UPI003001963C
MARAEFSGNENDLWFLRAYAWTLYDQVKQIVDDYENNRLAPSALSEQMAPYMREFSKMASPLRGDSAFSQMLRLAGKASKDWQDFLAFARWAGTEDFPDEDKAPFINDQGRKIDSLQKRFKRAIGRKTATKALEHVTDPDLVAWGRSVLEESLKEDPNDQWLNYYQSQLDLLNGDLKQAKLRLGPVLRRQSGAAWPWGLLGEILENESRGDAIICLTNAVQVAREEQEVAKVRFRLAHLLALEQRFDEAAYQAEKALSYRQESGYKVPSELTQLISSDWYAAALKEGNLKPLANVTHAAMEILKSLDQLELIYTAGAIDHINPSKALSYVATSSSDGTSLSHRKFPDAAGLIPGTIIEIGHARNESAPVAWRASTASSIPGLCETFSGIVERHEGQPFAFLRSDAGDVYIPPELACEFPVDEQMSGTCVALRRANKQGKVGWRAVQFLEAALG